MKKYLFFMVALLAIQIPLGLFAPIGPINNGQPLWDIVKLIGNETDLVESKVDIFDQEFSIFDHELDSQIDIVESKVDLLLAGVTYLTQADVSGGRLIISSPGNYAFFEDITTQLDIDASCVSLDLNNRCLTGAINIDGDYDDIEIFNGTVITSYANDHFSGVFVGISSERTIVHDLVIKGITEPTDSNAAHGILISGSDCQIYNCYIEGGIGNNGGDGGYALNISVANNLVIHDCVLKGGNAGVATAVYPGGEGGCGVYMINATNIFIQDCTMLTSGNGGDSAVSGKNAGDALPAIYLIGTTSQVEIANCTILSTGDGGTASVGVAAGGDGANSITILGTCSDISIHNCFIGNTGLGGSGVGGGASGTDGKAIDDNVAAGANESKIWANVGLEIANALKFDLQNSGLEKGFAIATPPNSAAISEYANVYM